jgi:STE24 endopeptidase
MILPPRLRPARVLCWLWLLLGLARLASAAPADFDPVAETEKYLSTLPAEARARSDAYFEGGYWMQAWDLLISVLFTWLVLRFGVVQRMRDWALGEKTTRRLLAALVFVATWFGSAAIFKLVAPAGPDWLWMVKFVTTPVAGGLVAFVFLKTRIATWSRRPGLHQYLAGVYFLTLFTQFSWVSTLPWGLYAGYFREHAYGLSNLSLADWFGESIKGQLIFTLLFSLLGSLLYLGIRKYPRHWWQVAGVVTPFVIFFLNVLAPVYVAPLFNSYEPIRNPAVRDPILALARANSVPVDNVYQFDASKQTTRISANVSGAFHTIRVSLNDNLLQRCSPAEVQAVMGHELGHYVLNHVYKHVIYFSLLFATAFAFTHWFLGVTARRWGAPWGLRGIGDLASMPLLWLGLSVFMYLATPVHNSIVRTTESEADIFGLNAARQPDGFATTALKLSEYRKLSPGPWEEIIFFDHPGGRSRILMAMRWKAEHLAEFPPGAPVGKK